MEKGGIKNKVRAKITKGEEIEIRIHHNTEVK